MFQLTLYTLTLVWGLSLARTLPIDYGYDNYVNVNQDNTNPNSYYMNNKPVHGFDYSPVNYSPFPNYYGSYRQEQIAPLKSQYVYPFHTIFFITTAPGQGHGGLVDHQNQGFGMEDVQPQQEQHQHQPVFHMGGHGINVDYAGSQMDQVGGPILLQHDFTHDQTQPQGLPMSTVQVPQPQSEEDYPKFPHQQMESQMGGHDDQPETIMDYPVVINAPVDQNDDVMGSSLVIEQDQNQDEQMMSSTEKTILATSDEEQKVLKAIENEQSQMTTSPPVVDSSPVPVMSSSMETGTDNPKWIKNIEGENKDKGNSDESPPIHPRDELKQENKVETPVTFQTIDADDEIFMTTDSGVGVVDEAEKMTTELNLN